MLQDIDVITVVSSRAPSGAGAVRDAVVKGYVVDREDGAVFELGGDGVSQVGPGVFWLVSSAYDGGSYPLAKLAAGQSECLEVRKLGDCHGLGGRAAVVSEDDGVVGVPRLAAIAANHGADAHGHPTVAVGA